MEIKELRPVLSVVRVRDNSVLETAARLMKSKNDSFGSEFVAHYLRAEQSVFPMLGKSLLPV